MNIDSEHLTAQNKQRNVDCKDLKTTYFSIELFRRRPKTQTHGDGFQNFRPPHPFITRKVYKYIYYIYLFIILNLIIMINPLPLTPQIPVYRTAQCFLYSADLAVDIILR